MEKFENLGLSEDLLDAIEREGFVNPSEIQEKTIPLVLAGKDVIGSSATGSGKTLAFGAGIIDKVIPGQGIQALILTPTRELAEQVGKTLYKFSRKKGIHVSQIYGGVSMDPQVRTIRNSDIIVGTPGRLLDHLERRTLNLSKIKFLVLDEADRMLDMGFVRDVEKILKNCPVNKQTLLFTATLSQDISYMARKYMNNPVHVEAGEKVDPTKLYQIYYDVNHEQKFSLLAHLLKLEKNGVVMVFCNTRRNTDKLTRNLGMNGIRAESIHGGHSQNRRSSTLQAFHERGILILICTDVAARGLDIKDVSHVYNYDIPKTPADYVHRIGRTARAGKNGIAISFVSSGDHSEFRQIMRQVDNVVQKQPLPQFEMLQSSQSQGNQNNRGRDRGHNITHGDRESFNGNRRFSHGNNRSHGNRRDSRTNRPVGDRRERRNNNRRNNLSMGRRFNRR
ncbi:MAG: DEAD/DEAH box helicase [Candidatus Pacearchaeota archaeon]